MMQPSDDYRRPEAIQHTSVDDFDIEQNQQILMEKILKNVRAIPVFLNDIPVFNAVMYFSDAAKQPPINVRTWLREYITAAYNGGPQRTKINRVKIWTEKGFLFLDYQNEKPEMNSRLSMSIWPVVHLLHMNVTKDNRPEARPAQVTRDDLLDIEPASIVNQDPERPEPAPNHATALREVARPPVNAGNDGYTVKLPGIERKPGEHIRTFYHRAGNSVKFLTPEQHEELKRYGREHKKANREHKQQPQNTPEAAEAVDAPKPLFIKVERKPGESIKSYYARVGSVKYLKKEELEELRIYGRDAAKRRAEKKKKAEQQQQPQS